MDEQQRKPLASFHVTALALHILGDEFNGHGEGTEQFFREAARLVHQPLPSPTASVNRSRPAIRVYAAEQLLKASDLVDLAHYATSPEPILREVFGDPKRLHQVANQPVSVTSSGGFVPASSAAAAAVGSRAVETVRSYGWGGP
jgi:hypothetical protein